MYRIAKKIFATTVFTGICDVAGKWRVNSF